MIIFLSVPTNDNYTASRNTILTSSQACSSSHTANGEMERKGIWIKITLALALALQMTFLEKHKLDVRRFEGEVWTVVCKSM